MQSQTTTTAAKVSDQDNKEQDDRKRMRTESAEGNQLHLSGGFDAPPAGNK